MPSRDRYLLALGACLLPVILHAGALIDPTRPAGLEHAPPKRTQPARHGWRLDSTLVAPDRRVAVINGQHVSEGETVDGARVIEIRQLDVLIQGAGRRMTLQLLPDIVQQQP